MLSAYIPADQILAKDDDRVDYPNNKVGIIDLTVHGFKSSIREDQMTDEDRAARDFWLHSDGSLESPSARAYRDLYLPYDPDGAHRPPVRYQVTRGNGRDLTIRPCQFAVPGRMWAYEVIRSTLREDVDRWRGDTTTHWVERCDLATHTWMYDARGQLQGIRRKLGVVDRWFVFFHTSEQLTHFQNRYGDCIMGVSPDDGVTPMLTICDPNPEMPTSAEHVKACRGPQGPKELALPARE